MKNVIAEREKLQGETKKSPVIAFAVTGDNGAAHTAGVFNKIGCGSAIRASSIALTLHYLCRTPLLWTLRFEHLHFAVVAIEA